MYYGGPGLLGDLKLDGTVPAPACSGLLVVEAPWL
jgi:hypothetical protein